MRIRIHVAVFLGLLASCCAQTSASEPAVRSGFAPVNGLKLYYEVSGSGEPIVLIHGGVAGIVAFGDLPATLAAHRKVIAVELQGHGRTADIDRAFSFAAMADDIAGLIRYLELPRADLLGYSLGGEVALQASIRHPDCVGKLVLVSTTFRRDGWFPEVLAQFDHMGPEAGETLKRSPLAQIYPDVNWRALFAKLGELERSPYDWSAAVSGLKVPIMLVFADADSIRPEHVMEFYGLLGGGKQDAGLDGSRRPVAQLAILPGLTHYTIGSSPALSSVVAGFLNARGEK